MNENQSSAAPGSFFWRLLLITAAILLARSAWTFPLQHTDAMQKAYFAAEIARSGDWSLLLANHHTLRWAAMLPEIALVKLVGPRYEILYLLPLAAFALYSATILLCLRNVLRPPVLAVLAMVLFVQPMGFFVANEFLVSGLGILFAVAAACMLTHGGGRPLLSAGIAGLLFFCAYGCHVTYLSFAAGGVLWLLLAERNRSRAAALLAVLGLGLLAETLVFNTLSGQQLTLGRLEVLALGDHLDRNQTYTPVSYPDLLTRWLDLPWPDLLLCVIFLATGAVSAFRNRWRRAAGVIQCFYLLGLCYALAVSFAVLDLHPLRPAMPLRPRYLLPFLPFAATITVVALGWLAGRLVPESWPTWGHAALAALLLLGGLVSTDFYRDKLQFFAWRSHAQYSIFSTDFRNGELLLKGSGKMAHSMLARFARPAKLHFVPGGIYAGTATPPPRCVDRLIRVPLTLNYRPCSKQAGERTP